jgi:hypothetical protein
VGGEGGVSEFLFQVSSYSFGNSGPHAKFQHRSLPPSCVFLVSPIMKIIILLIIEASLASAEVSAGTVAKADQKPF